jgi:1,2-diacylglycerol 3-alpha-glucosyltransferase
MRIAIFSDNFYPELSGISETIITTAKELARRDHQILFVVPEYSTWNYKKVGAKLLELDLGPNITVHRLPSFPYPTANQQGRLAMPLGFLKMLQAWKPDIMHTQLIFGAGWAAVKAKKKLKIPLIGTNHTVFREYMKYSPINSNWSTEKFLKYVSWFYNQCDYVTAPSDFIFKEMINYGFNKPHQSLSNPINTSIFLTPTDEEKENLKKKFGFTGKTILAVGRIAPEKKVDVVIKAFAKAKKTIGEGTLAIIGSGTYTENLKKLAKELNVEDSVKFIGFVDHDGLPDYYKASDMYAIASTSETQSMSMMDAMAVGMPVIAVNAGGLPEYAKPEVGFVVEPDDIDAFAEKIVFLCQNTEASSEKGKAGILWSENFSIEKIAQEWEKLFQHNLKP